MQVLEGQPAGDAVVQEDEALEDEEMLEDNNRHLLQKGNCPICHEVRALLVQSAVLAVVAVIARTQHDAGSAI